MRSTITVTGIGCAGRHGANPGEKDAEQPFVVDLSVEVEVGADAIGATSDYRELVRTVRAVVAQRSFDLLETIAQAVADAVAGAPGVVRASATVHKPAAARSNDVADVAATAIAGA